MKRETLIILSIVLAVVAVTFFVESVYEVYRNNKQEQFREQVKVERLEKERLEKERLEKEQAKVERLEEDKEETKWLIKDGLAFEDEADYRDWKKRQERKKWVEKQRVEKERLEKSTDPTTKDFSIISFYGEWEYGTLCIKGEVKNIGDEAAGVEIYYTVRDENNKLIDSGSFWPYSISNIEPGQSVGLEFPASHNKKAAKIGVRIKSVHVWD